MGSIAKYNTPKDAVELARVIELFMLDQFGLTASGGPESELRYDLEYIDAFITVQTTEQHLEAKAKARGAQVA